MGKTDLSAKQKNVLNVFFVSSALMFSARALHSFDVIEDFDPYNVTLKTLRPCSAVEDSLKPRCSNAKK